MLERKFCLKKLFCQKILLDDGWHENVRLSVDYNGIITKIEKNASLTSYDENLKGPVIPTMANAHSHAFQYAMAGLAEVSSSHDDNFWTWRTLMYRLASLLSPEDIEIIATKLYCELLKGGFGHVVEFHYLHHGKNGEKYDTIGETSFRILAAAQKSGIGLTHLPVFYANAGFGGEEPEIGQLPFVHKVDEYLTLLEHLNPVFVKSDAKLGVAIHSLRAATPMETNALLAEDLGDGPIHIHVAEQEKEVQECMVWRGKRPVEYLLEQEVLDERWCLIHATHIDEKELIGLVNSGAVVGLCPMTEANLGDGIFPATDFMQVAGQIAIGTDSHVATNIAVELQMLEYSQRLRDKKRNCLALSEGQSVGNSLFNAALNGGYKAAGIKTYGIRTGAFANLVVLDGDLPLIGTANSNQVLDRWIFGLNGKGVRDVMLAGVWHVVDGKHALEDEIDLNFKKLLQKIQQSL